MTISELITQLEAVARATPNLAVLVGTENEGLYKTAENLVFSRIHRTSVSDETGLFENDETGDEVVVVIS